MAYDVKCGDLARAFLYDEPAALSTPDDIARLAQAIQDRIEEVIDDLRLEHDERVRLDDEAQGSVR